MGVAPHQYVLQQRIERSKQLLKQNELSIAEIALLCGFKNQSHLTTLFRKFTGMTPKVFRNPLTASPKLCRQSHTKKMKLLMLTSRLIVGLRELSKLPAFLQLSNLTTVLTQGVATH